MDKLRVSRLHEFFFGKTTLPQYWGLCVGADLERIYLKYIKENLCVFYIGKWGWIKIMYILGGY